MKIAVSATGPDLSAQVDPRFGRCRYFIIVDPDSMEFESIENSSVMAGGGAGVATAQLIVGKEVEAVLTGNCGPNAFSVLEAAKIKGGSPEPNRTKVATITWQQVQSIAESKMKDLNAFTVESAMHMVAGTARSMGVRVKGKFPETISS